MREMFVAGWTVESLRDTGRLCFAWLACFTECRAQVAGPRLGSSCLTSCDVAGHPQAMKRRKISQTNSCCRAPEKIIVCTKFGVGFVPWLPLHSRLLRPMARWAVGVPAPALRRTANRARQASRPTQIDAGSNRACSGRGLLGLRTDYIDVLALHEPSAEGVPTGRIFEVLWRLVEKGVIRAASGRGHAGDCHRGDGAQPRLNLPSSPMA